MNIKKSNVIDVLVIGLVILIIFSVINSGRTVGQPRELSLNQQYQVRVIDIFRDRSFGGVITKYLLCDKPGPPYYSSDTFKWDCNHTGEVKLYTICTVLKVSGAVLRYSYINCGRVQGWINDNALEIVK